MEQDKLYKITYLTPLGYWRDERQKSITIYAKNEIECEVFFVDVLFPRLAGLKELYTFSVEQIKTSKKELV